MLVFIGLDSWLGRCSAECGKSYRSFSVAESHRTAQGPRQRTLLTLGPDFRRAGRRSALPGLRRPAAPPGSPGEPPARAGAHPVRDRGHGAALRPHLHLLRGPGRGQSQGPAGLFARQALRLQTGLRGAGAHRRGIRQGPRGLLRQHRRHQYGSWVNTTPGVQHQEIYDSLAIPRTSFPNDTTTPPQDRSIRTLRSDSKTPCPHPWPTSAQPVRKLGQALGCRLRRG